MLNFLKWVWRGIQKWAEPKPVLGLIAVAPLGVQGRALWYAFVTATVGSIGLWLPQATKAVETQLHLGAAAVVANIVDATLRGEMLILVPALLAPLYLLLSSLGDDKRMETHQKWILTGAVLLGGGTLWVYVIKITNTVADNNFLFDASLVGMVSTFLLLYLYFLQSHLSSEDAIHSLQDEANPMASELELRRKEKPE